MSIDKRQVYNRTCLSVDNIRRPAVWIYIGYKGCCSVIRFRIPCKVTILTLICILYLNHIRIDRLVSSCLCKQKRLDRKISDVVKTSVRNQVSVWTIIEISKPHVIPCLDVYNDLCRRTAKRCMKDSIIRSVAVVENNKSVGAGYRISSLGIHEEILRGAGNIYQTCKMEILICLLHSHEIIVDLDSSKILNRKIAVGHKIYMIA